LNLSGIMIAVFVPRTCGSLSLPKLVCSKEICGSNTAPVGGYLFCLMMLRKIQQARVSTFTLCGSRYIGLKNILQVFARIPNAFSISLLIYVPANKK